MHFTLAFGRLGNVLRKRAVETNTYMSFQATTIFSWVDYDRKDAIM